MTELTRSKAGIFLAFFAIVCGLSNDRLRNLHTQTRRLVLDARDFDGPTDMANYRVARFVLNDDDDREVLTQWVSISGQRSNCMRPDNIQ